MRLYFYGGKNMKKSVLFIWGIILSLVLIPMVFAGGGGQARPGTVTTSAAANFVGTNRSYNGYPLPIVPSRLELTAILVPDPQYGPANDSHVWNWFEEKTNIRIHIRELQNNDQASVIFASRDFPDLSFGMSKVLTDKAASDGDMVPLDDLLPQYAPSWNALFNNDPIAKAYSSYDGKIYNLPSVIYAGFDRGIRDQFIMTTSWLDELGLKIPETTEELKNVLIAFKNNAGRGTIPQNVIPLLLRFEQAANGTYHDFFRMFGIDLSVNSEYTAVQNGKVVYQAINPDSKEPLKYLQELYNLGLFPPESFTTMVTDYNAYVSLISSDPPMVGLYGCYHIMNTRYQEAILPPRSPNGKKPFIGIQPLMPNGIGVAFFENNKDLIASLKFFEFIGMDVEALMTVNRGIKDIMWEFTPDGKINELIWQDRPELMQQNRYDVGFNNNGLCAIMDSAFYENYWYDREATVPRTRSYAYQFYTKNNAVQDRNNVYLSATLSAQDEEMMRLYATEINNLRSQTFARWITTNANIDAEWDAFVAATRRLNFDQWLALKQRAYDAAMGR